MTKYAFILDYGHGFDLDPFPIIPAGAMYVHDNYIVTNCLHLISQVEATTVIVATEIGAAYLSDAISHYDGYRRLEYLHLPEIEPTGSGNLIKQGIVSAVSDYSEPITVVPSNIVSNIDLRIVEDFHKRNGRPAVTMVAVRGENKSKIELPQGYKPTELLIIERDFIKYGLPYPNDKTQSLMEVVTSISNRKKMAHFCFDDLFYEVDTPEAYLSLVSNK